MKDQLGITEIPKGHPTRPAGFYVRLNYVRGTPQIQKAFNIPKKSSREETLAAAIKFRDNSLLALERKGWVPRRRELTEALSNSQSGILGVSRTIQKSGKGVPSPNGLHVWQANWVDRSTRKPRNQKFPEGKYGDIEAFEMACACREIMAKRRS